MDLLELVPASLLDRLIGIGMDAGGDYVEVYVERQIGNSVSLDEHLTRSGSYAASLGAGIRVIRGEEVGYAYSDDLSPKTLEETAAVAASVCRGGGIAKGGKGVAVRSIADIPDRYPVNPDPDAIAASAKVALLRRGDQAAHALDSRVAQVMGGFSDQSRDIMVATSAGELSHDHQTMCRLSFQVVATGGSSERRMGFHGGGGRVSFSHYEDFSPEHVAAEAARMAVVQIGAVQAPGGPQTVVLSPGWSGILLHEAVGHGLEADFIHKGTSLFAGKLGQKVASELCTVIDSGTLPHGRGSLNIDDEGTVAGENVLIENGVLKGYMVDHLSGKVMGVPSTGSGRRQSYKYAPMPRMTNTYMAAGPHTHDEILSSVSSGIYCAAFGGGQVDISNGNFVFEVQEGYLIEDGKLGSPVKNATLIGVGPEALQKISMVGDNPQMDPGIGTCGKDGQSVPVGVGMPTVRLDGITVGGTG